MLLIVSFISWQLLVFLFFVLINFIYCAVLFVPYLSVFKKYLPKSINWSGKKHFKKSIKKPKSLIL